MTLLMNNIIKTAIVCSYFILTHCSPVHKQSADVLLILGYKCEEGKIHPLLKERLDTALQLYRERRFKFILVSGGARSFHQSEAEIMCQYLIDNHIPAEKIILENKSKNTVSNLGYCKKIMEEYHLTSCVLVSNSFHLYRIRRIAALLDFKTAYFAKRNVTTPFRQFRLTLNELRVWKYIKGDLKQFRQRADHS